MKIKILLTALLASISLRAAEPAWLSQLNVTKPGPHLQMPRVQLSYQLSWNGTVNSGRTTFRFDLPDKRYPNSYLVQIFGNSSGIARNIYPFDYTYYSFLKRHDYRPQVFTSEEKGRKAFTHTTNRFKASRTTSIEQETNNKSKKTTKTVVDFPFPCFDLASAMLYIRSMDFVAGNEAIMLVMPFKSPYLARVKFLGSETHMGRKAMKLDLRLQKIDKKTYELKSYDKMKTFTMWISEDQDRVPLEFRTKVFIGDVRGVLDSAQAY